MNPTPEVLLRVLDEEFQQDSPEAIAKWRESRKQNFPTPSNIQRKVTEKAAAADRGEKFIPERFNRKLFRYPIQIEKGKESWRRPFVNTSWINGNLPPNKSEVLILESYYEDVSIDSSGILIRKGHKVWNHKDSEADEDCDDEKDGRDSYSSCSGDTTSSNNISITDDEDEDLVQTSKVACVETPIHIEESATVAVTSIFSNTSSNALSALVAYSTDSELEDGEVKDDRIDSKPTEIPFGSPPKLKSSTSLALPSSQKSNQESVPADFNRSNSYKKRRRRNKNKINDQQQSQGSRPNKSAPASKRMRMRPSDREPTLLRRLLDDQICEERNAVLCASRFLVQHNFLKDMENSEDVKAEFIDCVQSSSRIDNEEDGDD